MVEGVLSSSGYYDGIRVESIHKRQHTHASLKVTPFQESTVISQQKVLSSSVERNQSKILTSTEDNIVGRETNNKYKRLIRKNPSKVYNRPWLDAVKILGSIFGILLFIMLILPSIFVYIHAPKSSTTGLSEPSISTNHCAGVSSYSLWQIATATSLTMIIDTSQCSFKETPLYFVSIAGLGSHFCLTGYGGIYTPTQNSFQIYVEATCGGWNGTNFLNAAQINAWDVNWMGFYK